jgi:hypothetical protein
MLEKLMIHGAALARNAAGRRRAELAEALREEVPAGVGVEEREDSVILSGRDLGRRLALEPALRSLVAWRRR